jgi:hypothetical protein
VRGHVDRESGHGEDNSPSSADALPLGDQWPAWPPVAGFATEEILLGLGVGGMALLHLTWWVAVAVIALLAVVVISYRQICHAYPSGGGLVHHRSQVRIVLEVHRHSQTQHLRAGQHRVRGAVVDDDQARQVRPGQPGRVDGQVGEGNGGIVHNQITGTHRLIRCSLASSAQTPPGQRFQVQCGILTRCPAASHDHMRRRRRFSAVRQAADLSPGHGYSQIRCWPAWKPTVTNPARCTPS